MARSSSATRGVLWDVVAPVIRWPLYSPLRLITVLSVMVLAGIGAAQISDGAAGEGGAQSPSSGSTMSVASGTPATPLSSVGSTPTATASGDCSTCAQTPATSSTPTNTSSTLGASSTTGAAAASAAAEAFTVAWAQPRLPQPQWFAGVRDYLSPQFAQSMQYTTPDQVPASKVTGPARPFQLEPSPENPTSGTYLVPTDAGDMRVTLTLIEGRWLIGSIEPASVTLPGD